MAGAPTSAGAKRARAAAFSAHEKYMHKSGVVLQREGKKIRAFLVRKAVAQLKQTREQHAAAVNAAGAEQADEKKRKRLEGKAKKLFYQVEKHEKELAALKTLDLKAVVARAFEKTGLKVDEPEEESEDEGGAAAPMSAHDREMAKYGRGRVVTENAGPRKARRSEEEEDDDDDEEEAMERMDADEDDDGFNSEDYDEVPRSDASDSDDSDAGDGEGSEEEESDEDEEEEEEEPDSGEAEQDEGEDAELRVVEPEEIADGAVVFGPSVPPGDSQPATEAKSGEEAAATDPAMIDQLIERVLTHNQMKPFLDAIRQYVEKKERDEAKKRRQKEKSALKRARASMVGGRSSAAPTSMFFGSLSGDAPDDDDDMNVGFGRASMAGAEDDIADFLGETKKKKNRPGQMARRQKAIRMEEARRAEEQEGAGGFQKRRFNSRDAPATGKYGPSERPKKQQKKDGPPSRAGKPRGDGDRSSGSWKDRDSNGGTRGGNRGEFKKPSMEDKRQERRARAEAAPKPRAAAPQRKPEVEPSHPSWVAKQALKEKMKVDINAFSGKKITFGDD